MAELADENLDTDITNVDRLCGLVVRVNGYTSEMYCAS
jgi:hypothetical protein